MPENPNYQGYPPYQPARDADELDEAALDRVVGGLSSPFQMGFGPQTGTGRFEVTNWNKALDGTGKFIMKKLPLKAANRPRSN